MFPNKRNSKTTISVAIALALGASGSAIANPDNSSPNGNSAYDGLAVYLEDSAINPGDSLNVHVSIPARAGDDGTTVGEPDVISTCVDGGDNDATVVYGDPGNVYTIEAARINGNTDGEFISLNAGSSVTGTYYPQPAVDPWETDLAWGTADSLRPVFNGTTVDWPTGVYTLRVRLREDTNDCDGRSVTTTFTVNAPTGSDKEILLVDNLYTHAARSEYGGKFLRLEEGAGEPNAANEVNVNRPMGRNKDLEKAANWLSTHYSGEFDVISVSDLADREISSYKMVVLSGENTVWTDDAKTKFDAFLGTSTKDAVILGAQTMLWTATLNGTNLVVAAGDAGARARSEAEVKTSTGLSFRQGGFINTAEVTETGTLKARDHWAFTGSGTAAGTEFGAAITQTFSPTFNLAGPRVDGTPVDAAGNDTAGNFEVIAWTDGTHKPDWSVAGAGTATPGLFSTGNEGYVFNAATQNWSSGLWDFGGETEHTAFTTASVVTKNIIDVFLSEGGPSLDEDGDDIPDAIDDEISTTADSDEDGIPDADDNCRTDVNPNQENNDGDSLGDVCDADDDNDGLTDTEEETLGTDPFEADSDGDDVNDKEDAFPLDETKSEPDAPASGGGGGALNGLLLAMFSITAIRRRIRS